MRSKYFFSYVHVMEISLLSTGLICATSIFIAQLLAREIDKIYNPTVLYFVTVAPETMIENSITFTVCTTRDEILSKSALYLKRNNLPDHRLVNITAFNNKPALFSPIM